MVRKQARRGPRWERVLQHEVKLHYLIHRGVGIAVFTNFNLCIQI